MSNFRKICLVRSYYFRGLNIPKGELAHFEEKAEKRYTAYRFVQLALTLLMLNTGMWRVGLEFFNTIKWQVYCTKEGIKIFLMLTTIEIGLEVSKFLCLP